MPKNLVLDTNIVLDLFVFDDQAARGLGAELERGAWLWLATASMREELARVLRYPHLVSRLAFCGRAEQDVLGQFDSRTRIVDVPPTAPVACSDPDDQKFIDLAVAHRAVLLSKDAAVLAMRKPLAALGVEASAARRLACS